MREHVRHEERRGTLRLLRSSERLSYDPTTDVDWATPLDRSLPAMPLERVSLYGTPLWDQMTAEQRVQLSWHETASLCSVGLWFEICLMQALLRHCYALQRQVPRLSPRALGLHRVVTALTAGFVVASLIDPAVYTAVGLDREEAVRQARAGQAARETRLWMAEKVLAFLHDSNMVSRRTTPLWRRRGLLP